MTQVKFKLSNFKLLSLGLLVLLCNSVNVYSMTWPVLGTDTAPKSATNIKAAAHALHLHVVDYTNQAEILRSYHDVVLPLFANAHAGNLSAANIGRATDVVMTPSPGINSAAVAAAEKNTRQFDINYEIMRDLAVALIWAREYICNEAPSLWLTIVDPTGPHTGDGITGNAISSGVYSPGDAAYEVIVKMITHGFLIDPIAGNPSVSSTAPGTDFNVPWFSEAIKGYQIADLSNTRIEPRQRAINNHDDALDFFLTLHNAPTVYSAPTSHTAETLVAAAKSGNQADVQAAIAAGIGVNDKNSTGDTALIAAALNLDADMIRLLLSQAGIDQELTGQAGVTAKRIVQNKGTDEAKRFGIDTKRSDYRAATKAAYEALAGR